MRPVILTFAAHYLPGFKAGGPIRTIAGMVEHLSDDFDFHIVTSDRDLGDRVPFPDVESNSWVPQGKARVFYGSSGRSAGRALRYSLKGKAVSLIYLNSMFSFRSTLRPLLQWHCGQLPRVPILLAPRGELNPGALGIKALKKRVFLNLARATALYKNVTFHASSELELRDIKREFPNANVMVAQNISAQDGELLDLDPFPCGDRELRAVFLSRISPKKNLLAALHILSKVSSPISFDIFGIIEDKEYWADCQTVIQALPAHVKVRFQKELQPKEVNTALAPYDFFFFPTRGENYGHVIREALAAGVPVLTSDQTPWNDLYARNAGATLSLNDPDGFVAWIEMFSRLGASQRQAMREAAHAYGNDKEGAARDQKSNRTMIRAVLAT